jgi:hypothetical protein
MWTVIRVPWVLSALAPPVLVLLGRVLGCSRGAALFAGVALASLPLHAAIYSSDLEHGPLLTFNLLGLALVAAGVRFGRAELAAGGSAVLAYTCWGRPDAAVIGATFLVLVLPGLRAWRAQPVLTAACGWFTVNVLASVVSARMLDLGGSIRPHLGFQLPVLHFLGLQSIVPFWMILPLPFGVVRLARRAPWRLLVAAVGIAAGLVPLTVSPINKVDPTGSYLEYFRYATWALPWIVLLAAEGMEAGVHFVVGRFETVGRRGASGVGSTIRAAILAGLVATPLVFRSYLARQYAPRVEEGAFRTALQHVPGECGLVIPDDASEDEGMHETARRYVYIAEEAANRRESQVKPASVIGVTDYLRSELELRGTPRSPSVAASDGDRGVPECWYYFRGSYCHTGFDGRPSAGCAEFERRVQLEPVFTEHILYISHRLVTRPDLRDSPLYDPAQPIVLSKVVGPRTDVGEADRPPWVPRKQNVR